ncbi:MULTISPECIES: RdgB/HAM1 family non-canonical purine NTP pyrophosphatase [Aeromonas]|uniref:RdgB/HAM1 family non-canonical purine NTP pyrophosphatase n=1 Tax=Aeromonas TaxID=642 RepID=UPI000F5401E7|nr:RdgB/HAM1 family non-canonical purine NTP pyrophosphatase [Aeromonas enteropelogenes]RQM61764.1 RdgB/HAM1 family non-canonical purine NTP pyrophosphatase [Aeromonas enteropelogenes]UAK71766.1 RdgB/HAM1 family non-canonical purine NTP pyrophosphatase [Aeromonas enteropelogenes]UBH27533.1 RdgB/HAM1 family non-canonical purine NTP pyrophosphatase [Aeromonas enteropelogenes]BEE19150.1 non-canonical purine NTP pyrophosphatase [Aeromonas enteropelogenes]
MNKLVLATGNQKKVKELAAMLADMKIQVIPQSEFAVSDADETGTTFVENAIIKARHAARITGLPAVADDSGLEVDLLHGRPGVYSARFAGDNASDKENIDKLLGELKGAPDYLKSARFWCVLVYMRHADDPTPIICQASWEGMIIDEPRGQHGFGYDPVFFVPDHDCTAAQMPGDLKNQLSHRGQALAKLKEALAAAH